MSTKTSIKRIAAVAAVALTLGGFSAVSAHAATTVTPSATAASTSQSYTVGTYQAYTVAPSTSDTYYTIATSGVGSLSFPVTGSTGLTHSTVNTTATGAIWSNGTGAIGAAAASSSWNSDSLTFTAYSSTAGTQTITVVGNGLTGTQTYVLTWGAAPVVSVANSSVKLSGTSNAETSTAIATAVAATYDATEAVIVANKSTASTTPVAAIYVKLYNSASGGGAAMTGKKVTATVTGSGLVDGYTLANATGGGNFNGTPAKSADAYTDASTGIAIFHVMSDGTSGSGSIAITYTDSSAVTTTIGTKSVIFFSGTPAKIVATQNNFVATAGTLLGTNASKVAGAGAITVAATDSNGNPVSGLAAGSSSSLGFYLTSDNTACITSTIGSVTEGDGATGNDPVGTYEINVNGASGAASGCVANVTVGYYISSTSAALATSALKFSVGGTKIYGLTLKTDAATYAPGDKVKYTFTATDSAGNPVADAAYGIFAAPSHTAAIAGLSLSANLPSTPFAAAATTSPTYNDLSFVNGIATSSTYAPYFSGTVVGSVTLPAADSSLNTPLLGTTVSASFTVTNPGDSASQAAVDAANEATDAANAATDAANNAMDSADAAQQAALDAGDKADAALAAVTDLATKVSAIASQIAALSALVKKIAAKVKA